MYRNRIVKSYLSFVEKPDKNSGEKIIWFLLKVLSLCYGAAVFVRNFLYDKKVLGVYSSRAKVISVGNISWAGSGKTSLAGRLFEEFSLNHRVAILRRGYGKDETAMLKDEGAEVFCAPDRSNLCRRLDSKFDLFILDDGFQHRKLGRDIDILMMGAREFRARHDLLPASFFREPFSSAKRADFIIINYKNEIKKGDLRTAGLSDLAAGPEIFFSSYEIEGFNDIEGKEVDSGYIGNLKIAALCAIGYPEGFFEAVRQKGLLPKKYLTYPDHYEFPKDEFILLQNGLLDEGFQALLITRKDRYHIPKASACMKVFIARARLVIEDEGSFLRKVKSKLEVSGA